MINFDAGELVTIDGREMRFDGLVPSREPRSDGTDDLQFLDARNRRAENLTPDQVLSLYTEGKFRLHRAPENGVEASGDDDSPSDAIRRRWRLFWTTQYDLASVPKSTKKLQTFIDSHKHLQPDPIDPPSPHTLRRWLRECGQSGDRRPKQMGDRLRRPKGRSAVDQFVRTAFAEAAEKHWSNSKATFEDLQVEVRSAIFLENDRRVAIGAAPLKVPGRTTLWRWLREERTYDNTVKREGRRIADRLFKAVRGSLYAKRILDIAILDQKRMDVHICDSTRRFSIGRPWLALLLDAKSRMVLGYSLSFEDPSVHTAMACLRAALRGKPELKKRHPSVQGEWESFGLPRTVLADNAWENTGSSFDDACADNGISIEWAAVRRPEHKGILERFFRRLDVQLAHKLPGAIVDHPFALAKREIDPQADASLTLCELDELLCRYFVDVYSYDFHATLRDVPLQVWRTGAARDGIEIAHDLASVDHAMGTLVRDRSINHEGVRFNNLTYRSSAVDGLLADLLPLQPADVRPGSAKVKIKYHPEDISRIFVWNEARKAYVVLPCTEETYSFGLSERVHNELQRLARDSADNFVDEEERTNRKAALLTSIRASYPKQSVKARRRDARMLDHFNDDPGTSLAIKLPVDATSNRVGGHDPEKARVRSRKPKKTAPLALEAELVLTAPIDPFASRDRNAAIKSSFERVS